MGLLGVSRSPGACRTAAGAAAAGAAPWSASSPAAPGCTCGRGTGRTAAGIMEN